MVAVIPRVVDDDAEYGSTTSCFGTCIASIGAIFLLFVGALLVCGCVMSEDDIGQHPSANVPAAALAKIPAPAHTSGFRWAREFKCTGGAKCQYTILYSPGTSEDIHDKNGQFHKLKPLSAVARVVSLRPFANGAVDPLKEMDIAYKQLVQRERVPANRLVLAGYSLGGAVAINLAANHAKENLGGLLLIAPIANRKGLENVTKWDPWALQLFFGKKTLNDFEVDKRKAPHVQTKVLHLHSRNDETCEFATQAVPLQKAFRGAQYHFIDMKNADYRGEQYDEAQNGKYHWAPQKVIRNEVLPWLSNL